MTLDILHNLIGETLRHHLGEQAPNVDVWVSYRQATNEWKIVLSFSVFRLGDPGWGVKGPHPQELFDQVCDFAIPVLKRQAGIKVQP